MGQNGLAFDMKKQVATRFVIGAIAIVAMALGYWWFQRFVQDPDLGDFDSVGHVVAVNLTREGGRVVQFDESGKEIAAPNPEKKVWDDRGASWSSDGQRVFISSNREQESYSVYRWNPVKNVVERRSKGSISQAVPWFSKQFVTADTQMGWLLAGGQILALDVRSGDTSQVLPQAMDRTTQGSEGGSIGAMSMYEKFGESFVLARPTNVEGYLYGLMRNDEGYAVILQRLGAEPESGMPYPPQEIFRARRVQLMTDDAGTALVVIDGFQFPPNAEIPKEFIKDGKVVPPFFAAIYKMSLGALGEVQAQLVAAIPTDGKESFGDAALSSDGTKIAVVIGGRLEDNGFEPAGLLSMPFEENGGQKIVPLVQGAISSPDWSPDGSKVVYLKRDGQDVDVYRANGDGSGETRLSDGGNWSMPKFSPQVAK
ncbi:hypothetical protein CCB80_15150 [Armatimonadetes bacterium Uphvl-Ar1]|nr:hypothetical protein CCB80_15150 [Armatimonadetes bacterium Uphvl-Ar1]